MVTFFTPGSSTVVSTLGSLVVIDVRGSSVVIREPEEFEVSEELETSVEVPEPVVVELPFSLEVPVSVEVPEPVVVELVFEFWLPLELRLEVLVAPLVVTLLTFTGMYAINILL